MKLLYQQMLAFFAVIMVTLLLLGLSFSQLTRQMVYNNTWKTSERYSDGLVRRAMRINPDTKRVTFDLSRLENAQDVMNMQSARVTIYGANNKVVFPEGVYQAPVDAGDWKQLKNKTIVREMDTQSVRTETGEIQPAATNYIKPYFYDGKLVAAVSVRMYLSTINANIQQINTNLLRALVISTVLALFLSYLLARYMVSRINRLRQATEQVTQGNYEVALPSRNRDELDALTNDFNHMTKSLRESSEEIERQEARRREFMANASHEMRTPLTTINGILEGLAYDAIPEESREKSIELMQNETNRLIRLVNENLDYEKIRTNQIPLVLQEFNATDALKNIVEQLSKKAEENHDVLVLDAANPVMVYADYDRFVQVMFNITQNAIQFTEHGRVKISAQRGYEEAIFRISDDGIGMDDDQLKNIWERYYKADPSRKNTKYGESGLGLSIVHQLVQLHHGSINVESTLGKGTTFTVIFPDENQTNVDRVKPSH